MAKISSWHFCHLLWVVWLKKACKRGVTGPEGDSYMKQMGMLVVSLRGVNFGFWSRLGCSILESPPSLGHGHHRTPLAMS